MSLLDAAFELHDCDGPAAAFDAVVAALRDDLGLRCALRVGRATGAVERTWPADASASAELVDTAAHVLRTEVFALGSHLPVDATEYPDAEMALLPLRVDGERIATVVLIGEAGAFGGDPAPWDRLAAALSRCEASARAQAKLREDVEEQRKRAEESEALHTLGLATNRSLALDEVLDLVARFARTLLGGHYATVSTAEGTTLRTVAAIGLNGEGLERDPLAEAVVEAGKPLVVGAEDAELRAEQFEPHVAEGMRVGVAIPLTLFGDTFGALVVGYRRPYAPTPRDVRLGMSVAAHAAVAIGNARLHAQVEERSRQLADAYDRLEELTRAKERFYNAVSHDLRTPVGAIKGYAELLLEGMGGELPPEAERFIARSRRAAESLLVLLNDLLDFAKLQAGKLTVEPRETRLADVVDEALSAVRPQATDKGLELVEPDAVALPTLTTDPQRVRQILINLLSNAVKFTDAGSVALEFADDDGWVELRVRDTGRGIPADALGRVFQEFEQVPGSVGTGLGLPISRNLAHLLGGDLTVESEVGAGSVFRLRLPAVSAPAPRARPLDADGTGAVPPEAVLVEVESLETEEGT